MTTTIKDIYTGKLDARNEVLNPNNHFYKSFIMPPSVDMQELINGDKFFIKGYKGSGKTALLYYLNNYLHNLNDKTITSFIYFKDYSNLQKASMNNVTQKFYNQSEENVVFDKKTMIKEQSFIYIWRWLFFERIREDNISNNYEIFKKDENWTMFEKTLRNISYEKYGDRPNKFPKNFKISLGYAQFSLSSELSFDGKMNSQAYAAFVETIDQAATAFNKLTKTDAPYYLFIDELEAYFSDIQIFKRDLTMLRDLIFVVKDLNCVFLSWGKVPIKIFCSIRTEIINSINRFIVAKELNKATSGYEVLLSWNLTNSNSPKHPIFQIMLKRIALAEGVEEFDDETQLELINKWFPEKIYGFEPVEFFLMQTWYKPRDIVRFLLSCHNCIGNTRDCFDSFLYQQAIEEYSSESMKEVMEELNANYNPEELSQLMLIFRGFKAQFSLKEFKKRVSELYPEYDNIKLNQILNDLYRVGFIGNVEILSGTYAWQHRGNDGPIINNDWNFVIHKALRKNLLISSKQDNIRMSGKKNFVYEGEKYDATIVKKYFNLLLVEFYKNDRRYKGAIIDVDTDNYEEGQTIACIVKNYNDEHKKWNLILDETNEKDD